MPEGATAEKKTKISVPFDYDKYLRKNKLPHIWCPGCGHGIVLKALLRAIDKAELDKNDVCMVSGIGCSSRTPGYVDFNTLHTLHGRALSYATGVKFAKPKMKMIVVTGDGDALAIGGNHFIHTCRRNIDMTILVYSNAIYGMTGGQFSPTTPEAPCPPRAVTATSSLCSTAASSPRRPERVSSQGRRPIIYVQGLEKTIYEAIMHKGTSVVEILDQCPIYFGRQNKYKSASHMMEMIEKTALFLLLRQASFRPKSFRENS